MYQRINYNLLYMAITLGILAAIFTALAMWIGYVNNQAKEEQGRHLSQETGINKKNLDTVDNLNTKIKDQNQTYLASLKSISESLNKRDQKEAEKAELEENLASMKSEVSDLTARLADYKAKIPDTGAVEDLITDLKRAKTAIASIETSIDEVTLENSSLGENISQQADKIAFQQKWATNHSAYKAQEELSTSVRAVYKNWGFVVLGAGDLQGVTPKSQLVVKRGEEVICELVVKSSTNKAATAEVLVSTLLEGDYVRIGDTVTAKPSSAPVVKKTESTEAADSTEEVSAEEVPAEEAPKEDVMADPFSM